MKYNIIFLLCALLPLSIPTRAAETNKASLVAHFPMELNAMKMSIKEVVSNTGYTVDNKKAIREDVPGAEGRALRMDGFSTHVRAAINTDQLSTTAIGASAWIALETYPMMNIDGNSDEQTYIAGNMKNNTGFAFTINAHGRYGFEFYLDGRKISCFADEKLPKYQWAHLSATVSLDDKEVCLYRNGYRVGQVAITGTQINLGEKEFIIGRSFADIYQGPHRLNTLNGMIDEIRVYSGKQDIASLAKIPENEADFTIPTSRFEYDIQRPHFHSMPAAGWANETHGLIHHNDQFHLFFQKNGNGPYWGRIHWGHVTSNDLITWKEVKTAVDPSEHYDIKGNWSGCVFTDAEFTNGRPRIYYTAVDMGKASIAQANPIDEQLNNWSKPGNNPVVPHRPEGLDEDFRDPYLFKAHGNYYMIVGSRKNGRGAATLHQYNPADGSWSNDGRLFFEAATPDYGVFWEMPVVVPMADGKWLFVVTPLGGTDGTKAVYWVGNINSDGSFNPFFTTPKNIELSGMAKDGFGMLSPSVMQHNGKTIAIGIVPDKAGEHISYDLGWAHTFSLPREWRIDSDNNLVQQAYEGLKTMRQGAVSFSKSNFDLEGGLSLNPVKGRKVELEGTFTVSSGYNKAFGFKVRKNGDRAIKIFCQPGRNKLTVDARDVDRLINDDWIYNGLYETSLPTAFAAGETVKLHLFIDHSIMDIFVNDKWAFSIRVFPTDSNANDIEVFAENGATNIQSVNAWSLAHVGGSTDIEPTHSQRTEATVYLQNDMLCIEGVEEAARISVYNQLGQLIANTANRQHEQTNISLPGKGMYILLITTGSKTWEQKLFNH